MAQCTHARAAGTLPAVTTDGETAMAIAAEHLLAQLEAAGIRYVFGIPGGGTMLLYSLSTKFPSLTPVLVRHEHQAGVMADAYARASGQVAAVIGQGAYVGAGASAALMEALTSSSPVVVIGDTSDNGMGPLPIGQSCTGEYGAPDLVGLLRAVTKYTSLATTPKEAVLGVQLAIKHALTGNPGPAALVVRSSAIVGEVDTEAPPFLLGGPDVVVRPAAQADARQVEAAVDLLAVARRPVILAGKGVHNAGAHAGLRALAECWAAPVVTSYKGKGAIEDTHPLALGMAGTYGRPSANAVLSECDLLVAVGAKLASGDTAGGTLLRHHPRLVQVDVDARNAGWALTPDVGLIGDARAVLEQLLAASQDRGRSADTAAVVEHLEERRAHDRVLTEPAANDESAPVHPARLVRLLEEHLEYGTNVTLDAGFNRIWMGLFYRVQRAGSFFAPGGMSGMGWALPAALGVKIAQPERPVVAVTGDGGFMMSPHCLATAVEHNLPVVCVVLNDSQLGMVLHHQATPVASRFGPTDHAAIARGFGAAGYRVEDSRDLPEAIKTAQASDQPAVIDVIIDPAASPDLYRAGIRSATET